MKKAKSWADVDDFDFGDDDELFKKVDVYAAAGDKKAKGNKRKKVVDVKENKMARGANGGPASSGRGRRRQMNEDGMVWIKRHEPKATAQLAVNQKKVDEVAQWIKEKRAPRIVLLTGPPGCGKTATVRAVCADLSFAVQEWEPPNEVVSYLDTDTIDGDGDGERVYVRDDVVPYVGHTAAFKSFMLRASRYAILGGLGSGEASGGKIVLLDEIPSFAKRDPGEFRSILRQYGTNSCGFPLVIVVSESKKEDELKSLLPPDVMAAMGIRQIAFNPIAPTSMVKVLTAIAKEEAANGVREFRVPDKESLGSLAESSSGDIRAAINALQFACLKSDVKKCFDGVTSLATTSSSSSAAAKKKRLKRPPSENAISLASIGGRDPNLDMFHAIGKVLYCKREELPEDHALPAHLEEKRRRPLLSHPQELLEKTPMTEDSFACFLHHNCPDFFSGMNDIADAVDTLSLADPFFNQWTVSGKVNLSEYGGLLAVRGLCFANQKIAKQSGLRTFHAPDFFQKRKILASRHSTLSRTFATRRLPRCEVSTVLLPQLLQTYPLCLPSELAEFSHFVGFRSRSHQFRPSSLTAIDYDLSMEFKEPEDPDVPDDGDDFLIEESD